MNMNCFNHQCSDGMDFRRQDSMSDMSNWYADQGFPPCGMPPRMILPPGEAGYRPSEQAPWMPAGSGSMPSGNRNMSAPMQPDMGTAPEAAPVPAMMGNMPAGSEMTPETQQNTMFCEDIDRFPIAMGYVPMQRWSQPSPLDEGFSRGTIFAELDLPFVMGRCM